MFKVPRREKQIKMRYNHIPIRIAKTKQKLTTPNANKVMEKLEFSYTAGRGCNGTVALENSLSFKHILTISSNPTTRYLPKRNENLCLNQYIEYLLKIAKNQKQFVAHP